MAYLTGRTRQIAPAADRRRLPRPHPCHLAGLLVLGGLIVCWFTLSTPGRRDPADDSDGCIACDRNFSWQAAFRPPPRPSAIPDSWQPPAAGQVLDSWRVADSCGNPNARGTYFLAGTFRGRPCYRNAANWWIVQRCDGVLQIGRSLQAPVYESRLAGSLPGNPWKVLSSDPGSTAPVPVVTHSDRCAIDLAVPGGRRARLEWTASSISVPVRVVIARGDGVAIGVRDVAVLIDGVAQHVQTGLDPESSSISFDCVLTAGEIHDVKLGTRSITVGVNNTWSPTGFATFLAVAGR